MAIDFETVVWALRIASSLSETPQQLHLMVCLVTFFKQVVR